MKIMVNGIECDDLVLRKENKKISIYELLGLIKDGKAPKKIKYCGYIYEWEDDWYLTKEKNCRVCLGGKSEDINQLYDAFNDNVEILDEEDEFIDIEEIENKCEKNKALTEDESKENIVRNFNMLSNKINDLIKNQKKIISKLGGKND